MALYYELPIYKDTYSLLLAIFKLTRNFKREYKYTIGQEMKHSVMQMVQHIFHANTSLDKREDLRLLDSSFEMLKLQLRLCVDLRLISPEQQAGVWEFLNSIGRQLTGWKKSMKQQYA
jgi:hypothetical protein